MLVTLSWSAAGAVLLGGSSQLYSALLGCTVQGFKGVLDRRVGAAEAVLDWTAHHLDLLPDPEQ